MIKKLLLVLFCAQYSINCVALEMSGTPDELRDALKPEYFEVTIVGRAEKTTYSNLAHITIVVTTKEGNISESLTKNSEIRGALINNLMTSGIPSEAIKNSEFSTSPHYGLFRGKKPSRYTVQNSIRVTATNENQLLTVNRSIDSTESAELGQIEFEVKDEEELKAELKLEAIANAKSQSESYGAALGLKLVPRTFSFKTKSPYRDDAIEEIVVTAQRVRGGSSSFQDKPVPIPVSVSFEQIEYKSAVEVVFEARPTAE